MILFTTVMDSLKTTLHKLEERHNLLCCGQKEYMELISKEQLWLQAETQLLAPKNFKVKSKPLGLLLLLELESR